MKKLFYASKFLVSDLVPSIQYIVFLRRRSEYVVYSIKGCHSYFVAIVVTKQSSSTYNMGTSSTICLCICKVLGV